jgi:hypothetical protein
MFIVTVQNCRRRIAVSRSYSTHSIAMFFLRDGVLWFLVSAREPFSAYLISSRPTSIFITTSSPSTCTTSDRPVRLGSTDTDPGAYVVGPIPRSTLDRTYSDALVQAVLRVSSTLLVFNKMSIEITRVLSLPSGGSLSSGRGFSSI